MAGDREYQREVLDKSYLCFPFSGVGCLWRVTINLCHVFLQATESSAPPL
jgi:hypothetical protein